MSNTIAQIAKQLIPLYERRSQLQIEISDLDSQIQDLEEISIPDTTDDGEYGFLHEGTYYIVSVSEWRICDIKALEMVEE